MSRINVRTKGASGEREFCKWLYENFNIPMPMRNLEQVRSGGTDIMDVEPFYFEVKRCETLSLESWWSQVKRAARKNPDEVIPVVAFRQNRKQWEFLIAAKNIGIKRGFIRIDKTVFIKWAKDKIIP